jgi:hypothetical protein
MNCDAIDFRAAGPAINTRQSQCLQETVAECLLIQVEEIAARPKSEEGADTLAAAICLRQLPPERRQRVVLHPSFRFWLQAVRRMSRLEDPARFVEYLRHLPSFIWPELAVAGLLARPWIVPTDELGGLRCPSQGRFIELGLAYALQSVEISPAEGRVVVQCQDGLTIQIPLEDLVDTATASWPSLGDSVRVNVPWRPDPRPLPGVFEGLFVFAHVAEYERRKLRADGGSASQERLDKLAGDLRHAVASLENRARFTAAGADFFEALRCWTQNLARQTGPVPLPV